ncbi:hypothetical protein D3C81_585760 [compost metagenome]
MPSTAAGRCIQHYLCAGGTVCDDVAAGRRRDQWRDFRAAVPPGAPPSIPPRRRLSRRAHGSRVDAGVPCQCRGKWQRHQARHPRRPDPWVGRHGDTCRFDANRKCRWLAKHDANLPRTGSHRVGSGPGVAAFADPRVSGRVGWRAGLGCGVHHHRATVRHCARRSAGRHGGKPCRAY